MRINKSFFTKIGHKIIQDILIHLRIFYVFQFYPNDIVSNFVMIDPMIMGEKG